MTVERTTYIGIALNIAHLDQVPGPVIAYIGVDGQRTPGVTNNVIRQGLADGSLSGSSASQLGIGLCVPCQCGHHFWSVHPASDARCAQ